MNAPPSSKGKLRYRAYFWLMDGALAASAFLWANFFVFRMTGLEVFGLPEIVQNILAIFLWPFGVVAPIFLLFARFMRDEYSEQLWRRTVVILAYVTAIVPLAYFSVAWATFFALGQPDDPPAIFAWSVEQVKWGNAIWYSFSVYVQMFIFIFQFLRWRDSR